MVADGSPHWDAAREPGVRIHNDARFARHAGGVEAVSLLCEGILGNDARTKKPRGLITDSKFLRGTVPVPHRTLGRFAARASR